MYDNVIVPYDGTLSAKDALGPASDLAWRCNARVVIVNNTEADGALSRKALKSKAMSMSGADVEFWVDTEHTIAENILEASRHRSRPILCLPIRERRSGLGRKQLLTDFSAEILTESRVPVMVVGPEVDVTRGLSLGEVVVPLDGSTLSEHVLPLAVHWAHSLRLRLVLMGVVAVDGTLHEGERSYLDEVRRRVGDELSDVEFELIEARDPATGIVDFVSDRPTSMLIMSTHGRGGLDRAPLGGVAKKVMLKSPQVIVFHRAAS